MERVGGRWRAPAGRSRTSVMPGVARIVASDFDVAGAQCDAAVVGGADTALRSARRPICRLLLGRPESSSRASPQFIALPFRRLRRPAGPFAAVAAAASPSARRAPRPRTPGRRRPNAPPSAAFFFLASFLSLRREGVEYASLEGRWVIGWHRGGGRGRGAIQRWWRRDARLPRALFFAAFFPSPSPPRPAARRRRRDLVA